MDKETETPAQNRKERVLSHAFRNSDEGVRAMAKIGGAAVNIDTGERTIGAEGVRGPITQEDNPKLFKAFQKWLVTTGRQN